MFHLCHRLVGSRQFVVRKYLNVPQISSSVIVRYNSANAGNAAKVSTKILSSVIVRYNSTKADDTAKASTEEAAQSCNTTNIVTPKYSAKQLEESRIRKKKMSKVWWMLMISGGILIGLTQLVETKKKKRSDARKTNQMKAFGEALIGGPFNLLTMDNKPVTEKDFLGKWLLIYFGFTHCPDVCPEMLEKVASAVDNLEKDNADPFVPLFISVDPERDTPKEITSYLNEFSSKIVGLTGTLEEVKKVCKSYRIYHSQGPRDVDNDYIVDHSIFIFLMRPDGKFADMFSPADSVDHIVTKTKSVMASYLEVKGKELDIVDA